MTVSAFAVLLLSACTEMGTLTSPAVSEAVYQHLGVAYDRVVHPVGKFPEDVENVQAAVDLGGTVLLKATNGAGVPTDFDFGPPVRFVGGIVFLDTDVQVIGERVGTRRATIRGGDFPLVSIEPVRVKIQGLNFEAPLSSAILILRSVGVEIIGNRIANVVGNPLFFGLTEGRGIKLLGNSDPDEAITGTVLIANNVIEHMPADLSDAIVLHDVAAEVDIHGNQIREVNGSGILILQMKEMVRIRDNVILPGRGKTGLFGDGIDIVGSRGARYHISNNIIICENPLADGIFVVGNRFRGTVTDALIEQNQVTMRGSQFGALTFVGAINGTTVRQNQFRGAGIHAMGIFELEASTAAVGNTFVGNAIAQFTSAVADVYLDSHTRNTVLAGYSGTVVDLGTGNQLTGFTAVPDGAGFGQLVRKGTDRRLHALTGGTRP